MNKKPGERGIKAKENYCINCEETVKFINGKCETCKGKYDDVVPASYRAEYKFEKRQYSLVEVPNRDYEWVCNECNFPNLTSSVSEDEIEQELHACINCGCFEMHKRHCLIKCECGNVYNVDLRNNCPKCGN